MTAELDAVWARLQEVEAEVAEAFAKAAKVAAEAKDAVPAELMDELAETPVEELLRGMLAAKEQADADRKQVARLLVLVDRLGLASAENAEGMTRLEEGAAVVATDLAAARHEADTTEGEPGAAADAGVRSPKNGD